MEERIKDRVDCNKIRRYFIRNKRAENVWFTQLIYKINDFTTFCVIPYSHGWKEFQKMGNHPYVQVYLLYRNSKGYMLLTRGGVLDNEYAFFTSHLFDRYRERELYDVSLDKKEVIKEFFKNNGNICSIPFPTEKLTNNHLGITEKGILFGERISDTIMLYKTYIRKDQLQEMQFEAAMQVEEGLGILLKYRDQIEKFIYQNPHLLQRINYY